MKRLLISIILIFSLVFGMNTIYADNDFNATNRQLDIEMIDGEIVVSGSFDAVNAVNKTYVVVLGTYSESGELIKLDYSSRNIIQNGKNLFSLKADTIDNFQINKAFVFTEDMGVICDPVVKPTRSLKVLAIGNSFSTDAMQWLYDIAKSKGIDNIVLGNVYAGSCSIAKHRVNATNNNEAYTYITKTPQAHGKPRKNRLFIVV